MAGLSHINRHMEVSLSYIWGLMNLLYCRQSAFVGLPLDWDKYADEALGRFMDDKLLCICTCACTHVLMYSRARHLSRSR